MKRVNGILAGALSVLAYGSSAQATVYDLASDWSIASNPNGNWTYGYLDPANTNTGANLTVFNTSHQGWAGGDSGVQNWDLNNGTFGAIAKNTTGSMQTVASTIQLAPGQVVEHPGNAPSQAADARFTAPTAMDVNITGTFAAADTQGTSTDVHVYLNGLPAYNNVVNGTVGSAGSSNTYSSPAAVHLNAGDTVDFSVGYGADGAYQYDGTSVAATLTTVTPEPASLGVLALGGFAVMRRRRA